MLRKILKISIWFIVFLVIALWFLITQPFVGSMDRVPNIDSNPARLRQHVVTLAEQLPAQYSGHELQMQKAAFIFERMSRYTRRVRYQRFNVDGVEYRNVLGSIGEDKPGCSVLVIGAHYDTFEDKPGADDNSSGVAGILEIMRQLQDRNMRCPVEFVAYANEEPPFFRTENMGSYVHAESLENRGLDLRLMISVEMIGYYDDAPDTQTYPIGMMKYLYSDRADFISVVGDFSNIGAVRDAKKIMASQMGMPVYSINAPRSMVGIDFSDHLNYWNRGMPALMVTDTAFYRNGWYHTDKDLPDTLDYTRMADVVNGLTALAIRYQSF